MMERKLTSTCRIWITGGCNVITVPKNIRSILGLKTGDAIIVDWGEIIKKEDMSEEGLVKLKTKKKLPKVEIDKLPEIKKDELPEI